MIPPWIRQARDIFFTAFGQIVLGYFTLFIQAIYPVWSSPFWPASGAALAAVMLRGPRMLVGVYLGLVVLGFRFFWGPYPFWMPCIIPFGNILETTLAYFLLKQFAPKFDLNFGSIRQLSLFILLCPWIPALVSGTYSQLFLQFLGTIPPERFLSELAVYSLGNATGILLVTPLILIWRDFRSFVWKSSEGKTIFALLTAMLVGLSFYYADWAPQWGRLVAVAMIPLVVWGVWRTGIRGATLACLLGSISYFAFDVPGSRPLSYLVKQKHKSAELQFVIENKLHPNEGLQPSARMAREISDQIGLLTIICITILPLGVAADELRQKARRDQMAMAALSSSFWNWSATTGLEIENPEIAKLFPPGSQLFSADRPSGSIKVYSNQKNTPTYLSHWAIQDTDTAGHPLKVTGILQNFTVEEERDAARLEARLLELEMQSLRAHLNPHLLFNCLTGLRGLISEDPAKAREFSGNLARFLRAAVDSQNQKTISLRQEILICEDFARLEELRGRPTTLKVQLEPEDGEIQIPPLTLVTLLENAAKHGNRNGEKFMPVEITSARPDARHL
ncbi:MAG: hypothetical protein RL549_1206, partial [Verrucomicrobiota bacterium]